MLTSEPFPCRVYSMNFGIVENQIWELMIPRLVAIAPASEGNPNVISAVIPTSDCGWADGTGNHGLHPSLGCTRP